ncbi:hypothetical protein [Bacillus sp. B-jedd]|uniref:hypothetical protein n=1 Tax=Bacillus sp. B-jedd TaxID=1476857 RepID=UPI0005156E2C|nr:hypothetical protein [Bacillus sp. B-jedd]CEG27064.1 hypothetical protein BN1002_01920 [Bacillus sp. B-jedd]
MPGKKFIISLYTLLMVGFVVLMFIIYLNPVAKWAYYFVLGYVVFLLISGVFLLVAAGAKLKNLKKAEIKKRILRFILIFVGLLATQILLNFIMTGAAGDLKIGSPLGLAIGVSFLDLLFIKTGQGE